MRDRGERQRGLEIAPLVAAERIGRQRHEQHRPAPREQIEPLPVERPRDLRRDADAVRIGDVERAVLRSAERERVHAHLAGARPVGAARIVADATDLEVPRRQMTDRVAADDEALAGRGANGAIQRVDHFRGRAAWT